MSEDLIKRSDAIDAIDDVFDGIPMEQTYEILKVRKTIRELPSADRPQGEWLLVEPRCPIEQRVYWSKEQALADTKGNGAIEKRKCSCCGFTKNFMGHMKDKQFKLWNHCPNCGARMKGADDE